MAGCTDGSFAASRLMKPFAAASAAQLKSSQVTATRNRRVAAICEVCGASVQIFAACYKITQRSRSFA